MAIARPTQLDPELQIELFLTDLRKEALPQEIFDNLSEDYIAPQDGENAPSIPNAVYLRLDAKVGDGRTAKIPMVKDLSGDPTLGATGDQRSNEEEISTKHFTARYTDVSHATTNQMYGIYARDKFPYKLFEQRVPLMGRYFKQYFGKMRRQALIEGHSENLEAQPHLLTASLSSNWFIPNLTDSQQPVYATSYAAWADAIVDALNTAGTSSAAAISVHFIQRLQEWAETEALIRLLTFEDGTEGYLFLCPTRQATWLKHPYNAESLGAVWRDVAQFSNETKMMYPGLIGQIGKIRFVEDPRYATLTISGGSGSSGTITVQYRGMGNADDGSSDPRDKTAGARQVGILVGAGAIWEWMPEGFHWEWEYEQYDKYAGTGVFCSVGMGNCAYDVNSDSADASTLQQNGSIIVPFAAPPTTASA